MNWSGYRLIPPMVYPPTFFGVQGENPLPILCRWCPPIANVGKTERAVWLEEDERCARLASNAARLKRRREAEEDDERRARLASDAARQERRRETEEEDERHARLASDAARLKRGHEVEVDDERRARLASDAAHHANTRDEETPEI